MNRKNPRLAAWLAAVLILAVLAIWPSFGRAESRSITVTGSTSLLPFMQAAAEYYMAKHPQARISVAGRGSGDGFRSLLDGISNMAGMSRQIRPKELAAAEKKGLKLKAHPVAMGCVVPVVDAQNPVSDISLAQLGAIYAGEVSNWSDLGGPDAEIAVYARDSNSGTLGIFQEAVLMGKRLRPDASLMTSNGAMVQAVAGNPHGLGFVGLGYLNPRIKALNVDGVAAGQTTVESGQYPLSRRLYVVTAEPASAPVQEFLDFLLSPRGQRIAQEQGLLPVN